MRTKFTAETLRGETVLIACSSHEERCLGIVQKIGDWKPRSALLFHYDDPNPRREGNHTRMVEYLRQLDVDIDEIPYSEGAPVLSLRNSLPKLKSRLRQLPEATIVLDISVLTRRHLLMLCQWLDDEEYWNRLLVGYTEPSDYDVSEHIPLSFGISSYRQIPGLAACPDLSRSIHLLLQLGYEGDRAMAIYEYIQPMATTLAIPTPPYYSSWEGKTERLNSNLIRMVGEDCKVALESLDSEKVMRELVSIFGGFDSHSDQAKVIAPLGTKPQALGAYMYARQCIDRPAIIYASPLRHNHRFYSHGIGRSWIVKGAA